MKSNRCCIYIYTSSQCPFQLWGFKTIINLDDLRSD
uniref:Uncharacterized protein n=1 Tax=Anguilla anguilla TaxID=7936 RepID=A0A0E9VX98_ANGAN